ncbi:MAG: ArnT family glycosyltransferase [Candidatus Woesearchaeota archaeon]
MNFLKLTKLYSIKSITSIFFLLTFFLLIYSVLIFNAKPILSWDEPFYYYQAQSLRDGNFVNFQNTQPIAYPLILSLFNTNNIIFLRLLSSIAAVLGLYVLFLLVKELFNNKIAFFSVLLLGSSKLFVHFAVTIQTEAFLFLFMMLSFYFFFRVLKNKKISDYIYLGIFFGLSIQTKVQALIIPLILSGYLIYNSPKTFFSLKYFYALLISLIIFIPYFLIGGINFLHEKVTISRGISGMGLMSMIALLSYLTIYFFILLFLCLIRLKISGHKRLFYLFPIFYIIVLFLPATIIFSHHFFPILPFLLVIIVSHFFDEKNKLFRVISFVMVILLIFSNARVISDLPRYHLNSIHVDIPDDCINFKELYINNTIPIKLPIFDQPSYSYVSYYTNFTLLESKGYMIFNYLDDHIKNVSINDNIITEIWFAGSGLFIIAKEFGPGEYNLSFEIENVYNIGGIGQLLICDNVPYYDARQYLFPLNEMI